jgi:hypothetical protein
MFLHAVARRKIAYAAMRPFAMLRRTSQLTMIAMLIPAKWRCAFLNVALQFGARMSHAKR